MEIRRLRSADAGDLQSLRLQALRDSPFAFGASHEEEAELPLSVIEERLHEVPGKGFFGIYVDGELSGFVALGREESRKFSHKAQIWGMYVAPALRGKGLGRALLNQAVEFARSIPGVCRINLIVNARNEQAVSLYRSAGFEVFGREPNAMCVDGVMCEALHMGLAIDRPISHSEPASPKT